MKTLHVYLTRQVLVSLLMTVAVFTFVMLLGNVMKEIIALLVSRQVTLGMVGRSVALLVPFVMAYVLPFGMLTAVLLVFGRFSADQELTAVRASGVSLVSLVTPILLLSIGLCGLCAAFNLWIAPKCRDAYKDLIYEFGARTVTSLITEDRFIDEIPGMILYIRKKSGNELEDVRIYMLQTNEISQRISAQAGTIVLDDQNKSVRFQLTNVVVEIREDRDFELQQQLLGPPPPEEPPEWHVLQMGNFETTPVDFTTLARRQRRPKLTEMTLPQLFQERDTRAAQGVRIMPVRVQIHRQISFSFACFAFTMVAIPLAIQAHRRETSIGVAIALFLVMVYYSFIIVGDALETREELNPHLIVWIPNFLFQGLGALLLYRANKG